MWTLLALACGSPPPPEAPEPAPVAPVPEPPPPPQVHTLTLVAGGDVLPHRRVKATARAADDGANHGGWDLVFADIAPVVSGADLALANLESPVAPDHHKGIHGEVFNAPASLVDGLSATGFDVLSMANNHVFDQGPDGLVETFTRVTDAGMTPIGAGPDCAMATAPRIVEHDGWRVAFLAAADLVNIDGNTTPEAPCLFVAGPVCTGDCGPDRDAVHFSLDRERLLGAVRTARGAADLVVVSFHWGDEYRTTPLPEYPELARDLVQAGADAVIGHHPHVLQPVQRLDAEDGRTAVIAYSLGNLVSDMGSRFDPGAHPVGKGDTRDGALVEIRWTRTGEKAPTLDAVEIHPTWTENNRLSQGDDPDRVRVRTHAAMLAGDDAAQQALARARRARIDSIVGGDI